MVWGAAQVQKTPDFCNPLDPIREWEWEKKKTLAFYNPQNPVVVWGEGEVKKTPAFCNLLDPIMD